MMIIDSNLCGVLLSERRDAMILRVYSSCVLFAIANVYDSE